MVMGYSDRLIDQQIIAAQTGYWSGYYQSRRPKSIEAITKKILNSKNYDSNSKNKPKPQVDVQSFEAKELKYSNYLKKMGVK